MENNTNSNNSAILNVVAVSKELPSLRDTLEIDPQHLYNSNYDSSLVSFTFIYDYFFYSCYFLGTVTKCGKFFYNPGY